MIEFAKSEPYTLGVEVELQIVNRQTSDLAPAAPALLDAWTGRPTVHPELFQSMLELNTGVCATAEDAERDLRETARALTDLAHAQGVRFISTGTHPTASYLDRRIFPAPRYDGLIERNQWIAKRLLIFGLHVHVGVPDAETCIAVQNELLCDLGLVLALSSSSPFWHGEVTGLSSSRVTMFEAMPTAGMPALVSDWAEFSALVDTLTRARAITSLKDLWWDIRPSPKYGTLELRVCDGLPTIRETCAVVALVQAMARRAGARVAAGTNRGVPPAWRIRENKWRAARHGMNADFVTDDAGGMTPARDYLAALIAELETSGHFTGGESYVPWLTAMARGGRTSSERQLAMYERTHDLTAVAASLADEFEADVAGGGR